MDFNYSAIQAGRLSNKHVGLCWC